MMKTSIIIPTFREADNLRVLIPKIQDVLESAVIDGEVIVVDDHSQDGTEEVCREVDRPGFPVRLFVRMNERGLSSAVVHGMRMARGERLLVMDADLSHPPDKIPELLFMIDRPGVDFVIGSRYVTGGKIDKSWGIFRWLNSRVSTLLARPLTSAKDPMAGFFAIRRTTFEAAAPLDPIGYKIGLELIVKCGCESVAEVPITFRDRLYGESKLSLREQLDYLRHLKRLYEFRLGRVARSL